MGAVNLVNLTGQALQVQNYLINGVLLNLSGGSLAPLGIFQNHYDYKSWKDFDDINIYLNLANRLYHIDLNRGHYFGGDDYHYPGSGSDVTYILTGTNRGQSQIQMRLSYRQENIGTYHYSDDTKFLDGV